MTQAKSKKFWVGSNVRSCPLSSWKSIGFFSRTVERNLVSSLQLSYLKHTSAWLTQALDPAGGFLTLFPVPGPSLCQPSVLQAGLPHTSCGMQRWRGITCANDGLTQLPHQGSSWLSLHSQSVPGFLPCRGERLGCSEAHWFLNAGHPHRVRLQSYSQ